MELKSISNSFFHESKTIIDEYLRESEAGFISGIVDLDKGIEYDHGIMVTGNTASNIEIPKRNSDGSFCEMIFFGFFNSKFFSSQKVDKFNYASQGPIMHFDGENIVLKMHLNISAGVSEIHLLTETCKWFKHMSEAMYLSLSDEHDWGPITKSTPYAVNGPQ